MRPPVALAFQVECKRAATRRVNHQAGFVELADRAGRRRYFPVMTSHSTVQTFTRGSDNRFVYAVHTDDPTRVFHLDDDAALDHRAYAKEYLRCPVPECPLPELTTVHRTDRRDGFRHLRRDASTDHAPESLLHHQGKAAIAHWLANRYRKHLTVTVEPLLEGGERRPDVMAVSRSSGARMAFEVQYSYEPPHVWRERHQWYRDHGIVDVWLFGHTGSHMNAAEDGTVTLNPTHRAVIDEGMPLLWLNPFDRAIATAYALEVDPHRQGRKPKARKVPATAIGNLSVEPLDEAWVTAKGLRTSLIDELASNESIQAELREAAWRSRQALQLTRAALSAVTTPAMAPDRRRERTERREAARAAQAQAVEESRRAAVRRALHVRWRRDPVLAEIVEALGGEPPVIHVSGEVDDVELGLAHGHWRTIAIADVLLPRAVGQAATIGSMLIALKKRGFTYPKLAMAAEMRAWLEHLEHRGIVERRDSWSFVITAPIVAPVADEPTTVRATRPERTWPCKACGQPLAQTLVDQGFDRHVVEPCASLSARAGT